MFGIKKKGRRLADSFHSSVRYHLIPMLSNFKDKMRFEGRARLANRWARKHTRLIFYGYVCIAVILLVVNSIESVSTSSEDNLMDGLNATQVSKSIFAEMSTISQNEDIIRSEITELGRKGESLHRELDSLLKIKKKTHSDSLKIVSIYTAISKTFNTDSEHEH